MSIETSRRFSLALLLAAGLTVAAAFPAEACLFSKGSSGTSATTGMPGLPGWLAKFDVQRHPVSLLSLLGLAAAGTAVVGWRSRSQSVQPEVPETDPFALDSLPIPVYLEPVDAAEKTNSGASESSSPVS